jgi:hypothetical protein
MYIPKKGSRRYDLYQIVNKSRGITTQKIIEKHGLLGLPAHYEMTSELNTLVKLGAIKALDNIYFPVTQNEPYIQGDDLVPSREAREFKPLKTFLPKESPRGQPIEARSFKYCNSRIKVQNPNNI